MMAIRIMVRSPSVRRSAAPVRRRERVGRGSGTSTSTVVGLTRSRRRSSARHRITVTSTTDAAPRSAPAITSVRWCMPRYIRAMPTMNGIDTVTTHDERTDPALARVPEHDDGQRHVARRGGGVPGREARVDGRPVEPLDVGPGTSHDPRHSDEDHRLEDQRHRHDERIEPTLDGPQQHQDDDRGDDDLDHGLGEQ